MRRYQHIVRVLMAHGLGGLIAPFDRRGLRQSRGDIETMEDDRVARRRAIHLRRAFEELGPAFVKLGQILSTRADILPPVYIQELGKLRDQVPPVPADDIIQVIEQQLGRPIGDIFATFERTPIAAASIGQVHAGTLHDGRDVAIKVQKPGVARQISQDVSILQDVSRIAEQRSAFLRKNHVSNLVHEFGWTIRDELDYEHEARNMRHYAAASTRERCIRIPAVYQEYSTSQVLTMERCSGASLQSALRSGSATDRSPLMAGYLAMLIHGMFELGLFHADPHPGNFAIDQNGALIIYDFGLMGSIDDRLRERLLLLAIAIADRDAGRVVDEFALLGTTPEGFDRRTMERDVSRLIARYVGVPLNNLPLPLIIEDAMTMMRRYSLQLPAELALLAKTAAMAESLCRQLDPGIDVFEIAGPALRHAVRRLYSPVYWADRLKSRPLELAMLGAEMPGYAQRFMWRLDRGDLSFRVRYDDLDEGISRLRSLVNRLVLAILAATGAMLWGMSFLAVDPVWGTTTGWVFFALLFPVLVLFGRLLWLAWRGR